MTFEEFIPIYQTIHRNREKHSADEFVEGLSHFDKEGSGVINVAELRHLLTTLGMQFDNNFVKSMCLGFSFIIDVEVYLWEKWRIIG